MLGLGLSCTLRGAWRKIRPIIYLPCTWYGTGLGLCLKYSDIYVAHHSFDHPFVPFFAKAKD